MSKKRTEELQAEIQAAASLLHDHTANIAAANVEVEFWKSEVRKRDVLIAEIKSNIEQLSPAMAVTFIRREMEKHIEGFNHEFAKGGAK